MSSHDAANGKRFYVVNELNATVTAFSDDPVTG
jgi:6-phosphogluconolactonase (cycloisomerase 2 family)